MGIHTDNHLEDAVKFGVVLYLNDDYEGGEINYPKLNLSIKPKARSLIIHPAGEPHGAMPVTLGNTRYILSVFVRGNNDTKIGIKGELNYVK
jgi:predicted 2-oxoglutarate/Fe(II)-dependent dioxygenase YbiX